MMIGEHHLPHHPLRHLGQNQSKIRTNRIKRLFPLLHPHLHHLLPLPSLLILYVNFLIQQSKLTV